jgi:hypothetical protein
MTSIILATQKLPDSQKIIRQNLNAILKLKASIMFLERDILKSKEEKPIDAFIQYSKLLNMKNNLYFIEAMVRLSNKWIGGDKKL